MCRCVLKSRKEYNGPGESIDTHIEGFCEKTVDFLIWCQKALGPKIWTWGPNHLKTDCWGPCESIDTHIEGFCKKSVDFWIWCQKAFRPKIWTWGSESPQNWLLGPREVHRHPYHRVLTENLRVTFLAHFLLLYMISPNFTKFLQISPNFSKVHQISPKSTKFLQSSPNFSKVHQNMAKC